MVEFKVDPRDGQAKLMEVNGRFWGSLQLAIDAGVNFPLLLYRLATGQTVAPQMEYRVGVRSRWLLGDLDHLLIRLAHSSSPDGSVCSADSRLRTFLAFMKFWGSDTRNDVFRLDDLAPGWFETRAYLRDALGWSRPRQEESRAH
jgi:predicted ATP-grasp superfamily ATP-dependent carboligase